MKRQPHCAGCRRRANSRGECASSCTCWRRRWRRAGSGTWESCTCHGPRRSTVSMHPPNIAVCLPCSFARPCLASFFSLHASFRLPRPTLLDRDHAPSAKSSDHRASGARAGSREPCSRGRSSCRPSVRRAQGKAGDGGAETAIAGLLRARDGTRSCGTDVPCHCEERRGVAAGSRGQWVGLVRVMGGAVGGRMMREGR